MPRDLVRRKCEVGRSDRLVRVLGVALSAKEPGGVGQHLGSRPVATGDQLPHGGQGVVRYARRVGPHVRDQTDGPATRDLAPLVEALRDLHRPAHGEPETARRGLLELRGDERGRRVLAPLRGVHFRDPPDGPLRLFANACGRGFGFETRIGPVELELLPLERNELRRERRACPGLEVGVDRPVLDRDERLDLALALADDPQGDRLDAAGGESAPDFLPEEVGHLVSHETVDDPTCLLRVDEPGIDLARVLHRREHGFLGDLVEPDPLEPLPLHR